jgi:hypothetical protein
MRFHSSKRWLKSGRRLLWRTSAAGRKNPVGVCAGFFSSRKVIQNTNKREGSLEARVAIVPTGKSHPIGLAALTERQERQERRAWRINVRTNRSVVIPKCGASRESIGRSQRRLGFESPGLDTKRVPSGDSAPRMHLCALRSKMGVKCRRFSAFTHLNQVERRSLAFA